LTGCGATCGISVHELFENYSEFGAGTHGKPSIARRVISGAKDSAKEKYGG